MSELSAVLSPDVLQTLNSYLHRELYLGLMRQWIEHNPHTPFVEFDNADPGGGVFPRSMEAARRTIDEFGDVFDKYGFSSKDPSLEETKFYLDEGIKPPDSNILERGNVMYGLGATQLFRLAMDCVAPDSTLLITQPTYGLFTLNKLRPDIKLAKLPLSPRDGWKVNPQDLEGKIDELRANGDSCITFLHINPNNPLGTVETKDDVEKIAKVVADKEISVIDDLVYRGTEYGERAFPIAGFSDAAKNTITLYSLSKAYGGLS